MGQRDQEDKKVGQKSLFILKENLLQKDKSEYIYTLKSHYLILVARA